MELGREEGSYQLNAIKNDPNNCTVKTPKIKRPNNNQDYQPHHQMRKTEFASSCQLCGVSQYTQFHIVFKARINDDDE